MQLVYQAINLGPKKFGGIFFIFEKNADVIPIVTGDNWQVNIISNSFPLSK